MKRGRGMCLGGTRGRILWILIELGCGEQRTVYGGRKRRWTLDAGQQSAARTHIKKSRTSFTPPATTLLHTLAYILFQIKKTLAASNLSSDEKSNIGLSAALSTRKIEHAEPDPYSPPGDPRIILTGLLSMQHPL